MIPGFVVGSEVDYVWLRLLEVRAGWKLLMKDSVDQAAGFDNEGGKRRQRNALGRVREWYVPKDFLCLALQCIEERNNVFGVFRSHAYATG